MPRARSSAADPDQQALMRVLRIAAVDPALPKTAQVYEIFRRAIVGAALPPGAAINERLICDMLDISRTPLREAILQLHLEDLVAVKPNLGTFVTPIDPGRVFEGQLVRVALEVMVARLAAQKMTRDFARQLDFILYQQKVLADEAAFAQLYEADEAMHKMICEHGSSPRIWRLITGARAHLDRVQRQAARALLDDTGVPVHPDRMWQVVREDNHMQLVIAEHTRIVEALKAGDADGAGEAMRAHIERVFEAIARLMRQRESEAAAPR